RQSFVLGGRPGGAPRPGGGERRDCGAGRLARRPNRVLPAASARHLHRPRAGHRPAGLRRIATVIRPFAALLLAAWGIAGEPPVSLPDLTALEPAVAEQITA